MYNMVFKRKSIRNFDKNLSISEDELQAIKDYIMKVEPLCPDIKVTFDIVDRKKTTAKRGEYCLVMYSEEKENHLQNAGYMLEQIDLFLASCNIGVCWYGVAEPKEHVSNGLKYIILLAFGKCSSDDFRKDISEFKRKEVEIIWNGNHFLEIAKAVRIAPSGCNQQPWRIFTKSDEIRVCAYSNTKAFPTKKLEYFNKTNFSLIDMGICLYYIELSLHHNGYSYERKLNQVHEAHSHDELIEIATYYINKNM